MRPMRANAPGWSWPSLWYGTPFPSWTGHRLKSRQAIGRCPNDIGSVCHDGTQNPGGRRRESHGGCCLRDCFQTRAALQVEPRPALSVWKAGDSRWTVDLFEDEQTLHWQPTSQGFCKLNLFDSDLESADARTRGGDRGVLIEIVLPGCVFLAKRSVSER